MPRHFPSRRTHVPILLFACVLAGVGRHVLNGYKDQYLPVLQDEPFVAPPKARLTLALSPPMPGSNSPPMPGPKRPPPAASDLGRLLTLMAEDPTVARRDVGMWTWGRVPTIFSHGNGRGNAVTTKAMPLPPAIEVPCVPLASGDYYDTKAEADFFVKQWLQTRAATNRAEIVALVHTAELTVLDLMANLKGRSLAHRESLTKYWQNYRDFSRASTRLAELAALDALAGVPGKSIVLDGKEYFAVMSSGTVDVRAVTNGKIGGGDP
jgi:hypothetical protein